MTIPLAGPLSFVPAAWLPTTLNKSSFVAFFSGINDLLFN
jgi:hypothetical protein